VKNKSRFFAVLLLVAIYSLGIGISGHSQVASPKTSASDNAHQNTFSPVFSPVFFHISEVTFSSIGILSIPKVDFKNPFEKLVALANAFELIAKTEHSQYANFWCTLLINYRKTDLLFPFHYFW